jgi:recombination protein RecT
MSELALAKPNDLFAYFQSKMFHDKLVAAIPNAIKPERMIQLALTMIKGSPSLMKCSPISLMSCVVECAQLGLELDRILGHAYIVPFKEEATLIIGYRGFAHLMYQSGIVSGISAEVVRAKDRFHYQYGTQREIVHTPAGIPKNDDPENWRGAYAVAHMLTGATEFEYMEASKIIATRNRSKSWQSWLKFQKSTPWQTDTEEMWRKTPIRRLAKRMPVSTTDKREILLRAVMVDEYSERPGLLKPTEHGFEVSDEAVAEPIAPTMEQQLQASIEIANAKKGAPKKQPTKPTKLGKGTVVQQGKVDVIEEDFLPDNKLTGPPKANIPPPVKIDDPFLTTKQQTEIFHKAAQSGWRIPEELNAWLLKTYKTKSLREMRASHMADILARIASGT